MDLEQRIAALPRGVRDSSMKAHFALGSQLTVISQCQTSTTLREQALHTAALALALVQALDEEDDLLYRHLRLPNAL